MSHLGVGYVRAYRRKEEVFRPAPEREHVVAVTRKGELVFVDQTMVGLTYLSVRFRSSSS